MQKFELTIFRETRLYIGLALFPFALLGSIFLGIRLGGLAFVVILLVVFFLLLGYFVIGHLTITFDNDELQFQWIKKYFFNYKDIDPVKLSDINTIILDNGQFLRKIKTSDRTIHINNNKIKPKDASKFIYQLSIATKNYDIKIIESWDVVAEKGYLKIAYWINTSILILVGIIIIIAIAKGYYTRHFFWVLFLLPQQILFGRHMKQKLNKQKLQVDSNDTTSDRQ